MSTEALCVEHERAPLPYPSYTERDCQPCTSSGLCTHCVCVEGHSCIDKHLAPVHHYPPVLYQLRHWSHGGWKIEKEQNNWKAEGEVGGHYRFFLNSETFRLLLYDFSLYLDTCLVENIPISQNIRARTILRGHLAQPPLIYKWGNSALRKIEGICFRLHFKNKTQNRERNQVHSIAPWSEFRVKRNFKNIFSEKLRSIY